MSNNKFGLRERSGEEQYAKAIDLLRTARTLGWFSSAAAFFSAAEEAYRREGLPEMAQKATTLRLNASGSRVIGEEVQRRGKRIELTMPPWPYDKPELAAAARDRSKASTKT